MTYINETWEKLHALAEPSGAEEKTAAYIKSQLEIFGISNITTNVGGSHGIIAILESGKPGPNLGLRADMDALTYVIDGKTEYRHMCGHDAHMTMVLAAAKEAAERGIEKGKLYLVFQPAEETLKGSMDMINSGLMGEIDEIIGMHIRPEQDPVRLGQASARMHYSAAAPIKVKIKGLNAHASRPHLGINAAYAAVLITNAIASIQTDPNVPASAKVTKINTGDGANNIIPDEANMYIDVRAQNNEVIEELVEKLKNAIEGAAKAIGAEVEYTVELCPASEYTDETIELLEKSIVEALGEEGLAPGFNNVGSEDFNNYGRELGIKNGFVALGAEATPGVHAVNMTFNHQAMENGAKIHLAAIKNRLGLK